MSSSDGSGTAFLDGALTDVAHLKSRAARGSALSAVAQVMKIVLQFGSTIALARMLYPSDFGLVAMIAPVIAIIQVFGNLGFGQIIVQRDFNDVADLSSLFWLNLAASCGLAMIGCAAAPVTSWMYAEPRLLWLMMAMSALLPVTAAGSIHNALLAREMRFGILVRNDLAASVIAVTVTVTSAAIGWGYWSLLLGQATAQLASASLAWASLSWRPTRVAFTKRVWADLVTGMNLTGASLAGFITTSGDNIIIGVINGERALGIYDRSYRLVVQPLGQLILPLSSVAVPLLSRLRDNETEYRSVFLLYLRLVLMATLPVSVVCISNSATIIAILLGPRWQEAGPTFAWISVGGLMSGLYTCLPWLFLSQGRMQQMRRYLSIAAIFNLASFGVGACWGVVGVASCAALVFSFVTSPIVVYGATRFGSVTLLDLVRCLFPYSVACAASILILMFVIAADYFGPIVNLSISAFVSLAAFGCIGLVSSPERQVMIFISNRAFRFLGRFK